MTSVTNRILATLAQSRTECPLEEVVNLCCDTTWNQVFLAIDHLSRTGQVRVRIDASRTYWVQAYPCIGENSSANSPIGSPTFEPELHVS